MLLPDFYKIEDIKQSESETIFHIRLNPDHVIYSGHFPGQPVLPGVCTLQIIKECAQQLINKKLQYMRIILCKFLRFVDPAQCSEIILTVSANENSDGTVLLVAGGENSDYNFIKVKAIMKVLE